jgi:hypothetical protein
MDYAMSAMEQTELYCSAHPGSPSAVRRPRLLVRGELWIALLGPSVEEGIVGIGPTIAAALRAFDAQYLAGLRPPTATADKIGAQRRPQNAFGAGRRAYRIAKSDSNPRADASGLPGRREDSSNRLSNSGSLIRVEKRERKLPEDFHNCSDTVMRTTGQKRIHQGGMLMGTARRERRRWRTTKPKRRSRQSSKSPEAWQPEIMNGDESAEAEVIDRLLLSSLRFWEVERDLIEERLEARGC